MSPFAGLRVAWRVVPAGVSRREVSRSMLAEMLPGARFVSVCPRCAGAHGRVHVRGRDAAVSVSYVGEWAVVAVAPGHVRVGVDAAPRDATDLDRVLVKKADGRSWARVEAVLKADGRGLTVDPLRVDVHETRDGWEARIDGGRRWCGLDLDGPADLVIAVAVSATAGQDRPHS